MPGQQVASLWPAFGNQRQPKRMTLFENLVLLDAAESQGLEKAGAKLQIVRAFNE